MRPRRSLGAGADCHKSTFLAKNGGRRLKRTARGGEKRGGTGVRAPGKGRDGRAGAGKGRDGRAGAGGGWTASARQRGTMRSNARRCRGETACSRQRGQQRASARSATSSTRDEQRTQASRGNRSCGQKRCRSGFMPRMPSGRHRYPRAFRARTGVPTIAPQGGFGPDSCRRLRAQLRESLPQSRRRNQKDCE